MIAAGQGTGQNWEEKCPNGGLWPIVIHLVFIIFEKLNIWACM